MRSAKKLAVVASVFIAVGFLADSIAQYPAYVTRSISRSNSYHPAGYQVFRASVLRSIGGVLSQTGQLVDEAGEQVPVSLEMASDKHYPGHIIVSEGRETGTYKIEYADLVPMALFVDSGGTSLYTLWSENDLPDNFSREAGFLELPTTGHVAIEFGETRFADALLAADICEICVGPTDPELKATIVGTLSSVWNKEESNEQEVAIGSYINTDVASQFHLRLRQGSVTVGGSVARLSWEMDTLGQVSITEAAILVGAEKYSPHTEQNLVDIENLLEDINSQFDGRLLSEEEIDKWIDISSDLPQFYEEMMSREARQLEDAFFLFETLALLRAARESDQMNWSRFITDLSSKELVSAEPEPWERYTWSFCSVYPEEPECVE
jgi:hypothetical protein